MAIAITDIELYEVLKAPLGELGAKTLVNFVDSKVESAFQQKMEVIATKQDIADLRVDMAKMESRLIKWMFIFWIGQIATVIAIMKLL